MSNNDVRPYAPPSLVTLREEDLIEALGPAQTQYVIETQVWEGCLPVVAGNTAQDSFTFNVPTAPNIVNIFVDSVDCAGVSCLPAIPPDDPEPVPAVSELDPKFALYEPGVTPAPLAEYSDPACGGPCIILDGNACTIGSPPLALLACPSLTITLPTTGDWTIAVNPEVAAPATGSEGCYRIEVEGLGVGPLVQTSNNVGTTFRTVVIK